MISLFKSNETDFSHNGIGNLDYHIINPVVEEELNGLYSFTFRYPLFAPHGLEIEGQSTIRVPVPGMEDQLFRVYRPVKSMGYITVSCYHVFYDLADNFIEDTNIVEKDGQGAIQQLGGATQFGHRFNFFSDIPTVANARLVRRNPVAAILDDELDNSFISRWGGELIRNNFDVRMNQSAGSNAGFTVKYRKNLTGYEADIDISTVVTRIMPKGFDGLLLPEKYIDSPHIDNYETPKIKMIDYNDIKAAIGEYADDEDAIPLDEAYNELRRLSREEYSIHKVDVPSVQYKVNFVMLEQTEEYKGLEDLQKLKMGDMVTVDHEDDDFKVTAKLVHYKYDPVAKRYLSAELGSIHDGITNRFSDIKKINRIVDEIAERTTIIQATADGKNTIYRGEVEPSNPNIGDLWYKPNGSETEMYQFVEENGQKFWKLIADTGDVTKVQKDVDQATEYAQEARNSADEAVAKANLATSNANEAIEQAQTAFDEAQTAISTADIAKLASEAAARVAGDASTLATTARDTAQTAISNAQSALTGINDLQTSINVEFQNINGELSRKVSQATFDGLQSTVTSHSTLIQQNAEGITRKADKTYVDTVNKTVESHSLLIEETAEGLKAKANQSTVNTLTGQVEAHTVELQLHAQELSSKMTTIDADAKFATQSQLSQTSGSLSSEIVKVQKDLDGLEIGGRNLITNSAGDSLDGWAMLSNTSLTNRNMLGHDWIYAVKTGGTNFGVHTPVFDLKANVAYTISFTFRSYSNSGYNLNYLFLRQRNPSLSTIKSLPNVNMAPSSGFKGDIAGEGARVWFTFSHTEDVENATILMAISDRNDGSGFLLREIQVEEGTRPSGWNPAPEELTPMVEFSKLEQTVGSITTRVGDAEGNITSLQQTSSSFATRIGNAEGNISTLTQTANGLQNRIKDAEGNISTFTQLATAMQARLTDAEGNINTLTQTATSLDSTIRNGGRNLIKASKGDTLDDWIAWGNSSVTNSNYIGFDWIWIVKGTNSQLGVHTPVFNMKANVTYTCSMLIRSRSNSGYDLNYLYLRSGKSSISSIKSLPTIKMNSAEFVGDIAKDGVRVWFTFSHNVDVENARLLIAIDGRADGSGVVIREIQVEEGEIATPYIQSPEEIATQSQITQLSDNINARVQKGETITQINIDGRNSSVLIEGRNLILDGDTTVTGTFRVSNAHITSVSADKMTTGTLNAANVNIINMNAGNITTGVLKAIDIEGVNIRGSIFRGGTIYADGLSREFLYANAIDVNPNTAGVHLYVRAKSGGEVRATETNTLDSYVGMRARVFRAPPLQDLLLATDGEVKVINLGESEIYRDVRANWFIGDALEVNKGTHVYLRPKGADGEARVTASGSTTAYRNLRANRIYGSNGWTNGQTLEADITNPDVSNMYIRPRAGFEVRFTSAGTTDSYVRARASFISANALDVNTGTHLYVRPSSAGEVRATVEGTTESYAPIRASEFRPPSSSRDTKQHIDVFDINVLDEFRSTNVYTYLYKWEEDHLPKRLGVMLDETPKIIHSRSQDTMELYSMTGYLWKGIKDLVSVADKHEDEMSILRKQNENLILKVASLEAELADLKQKLEAA